MEVTFPNKLYVRKVVVSDPGEPEDVYFNASEEPELTTEENIIAVYELQSLNKGKLVPQFERVGMIGQGK